DHRDHDRRQRATQARHGAQGRKYARRSDPRQDDCAAWADLQAEYRRHAGGAVDRADHRPAGPRRRDPRLRARRRRACKGDPIGPHVLRWPYAAATGAHALVILTEWEQFRALDLDRLKRVMANPVIVDLKNVYQPEDVIKAGFVYESVGRPAG